MTARPRGTVRLTGQHVGTCLASTMATLKVSRLFVASSRLTSTHPPNAWLYSSSLYSDPSHGAVQFDMCKHIPQHDFILLSEHYAHSKALEPKSFRKLLFQLGVTDCIQAAKQTVSLSQASKPTSPWGLVNLGDAAEGGWLIQDHSAQEFEAVVQSIIAAEDETQVLPSMQYLAELLSVHWAAHVGHWLSATCVNKSTGNASSAFCTSGGACAACLSLYSLLSTVHTVHSCGNHSHKCPQHEVTCCMLLIIGSKTTSHLQTAAPRQDQMNMSFTVSNMSQATKLLVH